MALVITEANAQTTYRAGSNAPADAKFRVRGALPLPQFTASGLEDLVSWSDNGAGGTFEVFSTFNEIAVYTPANKTQVVTITANDSDESGEYALTVFGTIPVHPQLGYEIELDAETKTKKAKDGTQYHREDEPPTMGWAYAWDNRMDDEHAEMRQFWFNHRRVTPFYLVDVEGDVLNRVKFVSALKSAPNGANRWAMGASFKGAYEGIAATTAEPVHLRINVGGFAVGIWQADQYFTNGQTFFDPDPIDSSGVVDPAPDVVYQWVRFDDDYLQYLVTGLRPASPYDIRLHFCANTARTIVPTIQFVTKPAIVVPISHVAIAELIEGILTDAFGQLIIRLDHTAGANTILNGLEIIEP